MYDKCRCKNMKMIYKTPGDLNKAGHTATPVACGWVRAIVEVSGTFEQEQ